MHRLLSCAIWLGALSMIVQGRSPASIGIVGNPLDVVRITTGGTVLMGGGTDVDEIFQWMIQKAGGGDFVVIRATGTDAYNSYIYGLGVVDSVETLLINSKSLANNAEVVATLRLAEAVFIAGGDQANYVNFWKGTQVEEALNWLRNVKEIPIGGTSAGCAILGRTYFSALSGTVTSDEALQDPYNKYMTFGRNDFLDQPYLSDVITDTHFNDPDRRGRLVTFLARMNQDYEVLARGIGLDESTAVCIESNGTGRVFGSGTAFFLNQNGRSTTPETCVKGTPLDWYRSRQAVAVYKINGDKKGSGTFDLTTWNGGSGGVSQYYYVDHGRLGISSESKK